MLERQAYLSVVKIMSVVSSFAVCAGLRECVLDGAMTLHAAVETIAERVTKTQQLQDPRVNDYRWQ